MISGFSLCTNCCHASRTSLSELYVSTAEFSIGIAEHVFKTIQ